MEKKNVIPTTIDEVITGYKFLDTAAMNTNCNVSMAFNEVVKCLESEGVKISRGDLIRVFDIYLRYTFVDAKIYQTHAIVGIHAITDPHAKVVNIGDYIASGKVDSYYFEAGVAVYNSMASADNKMDDVKAVLANIAIILKELSIFLNDIMKMILDIEKFGSDRGYNNNSQVTVTIIADDSNPNSKMIQFILSKFIPCINRNSLMLVSDVYGPIKSDVLLNFNAFPDSEKELIKNNI